MPTNNCLARHAGLVRPKTDRLHGPEPNVKTVVPIPFLPVEVFVHEDYSDLTDRFLRAGL
jgi:hypothetical protein